MSTSRPADPGPRWLEEVLSYAGSTLHLSAIGAAMTYLLAIALLDQGGWPAALPAPVVYGGVVAALLYRNRTPDQRYFVYLNDPRIILVLQGLGRSVTEGSVTVVQGANLGINGVNALNAGFNRQREITQSLNISPRERYRKLEKYLRIPPAVKFPRHPDGYTIYKMHVQILQSERVSEQETLLKVWVAEAEGEAWTRIEPRFLLDEGVIVQTGTTLSTVGWLQAAQPLPEDSPLRGKPDLRLRCLAMWSPRDPEHHIPAPPQPATP
ncbi:hypothetical protein [Kineosporia babensis]|uniref:Uncharacterized protein n=1 Tax=Kineosporia babensis TaxID=499548 RepID=A0A9X1NCC1_9ACTN|nr:hypothetical protein [Kineosporia babensis]MCD5311234.1 hypothetical protein [Kineosporia babensis]